MKTRTRHNRIHLLLAAVFAWPALGVAQVPVDDAGQPIGEFQAGPGVEGEQLNVLSAAELDELIGPIALYPDDLLAIVLPASTYPLQIVEAARFLENLETDSSLKPDEDWDDSIVALINYPEIVELMNEDLDWTWRLGEAVVAQQTEVIEAIEDFRDRAYAAGNLKSDDFQSVTEEDGTIHITPVQEDVIYVPYYEPERVVVYQPRPVYYYYPRSYPLYYYPYPVGYSFYDDYFWGVTTAFAIGWHTHHLHVWHHSYYGHPYYGYTYWPNWWYRRPDIHIYNRYYARNRYDVTYDRYNRGDYWQPRSRRTVGADHRLTRTRYYPNSNSQTRSATTVARNNEDASRATRRGFRAPTRSEPAERPAIRFRERSGTATTNDRDRSSRSSFTRPSGGDRRQSSSAEPRHSFTNPSTRPRPSTDRRTTPSSQPTMRSPSQAPSRQPATRPSYSQQRSAIRPSSPAPRPSMRSTPSRQPSARPSAPSRSSPARPSTSSRQSSAPSRSSQSRSRSSDGQKASRNSSSRRSHRDK